MRLSPVTTAPRFGLATAQANNKPTYNRPTSPQFGGDGFNIFSGWEIVKGALLGILVMTGCDGIQTIYKNNGGIIKDPTDSKNCLLDTKNNDGGVVDNTLDIIANTFNGVVKGGAIATENEKLKAQLKYLQTTLNVYKQADREMALGKNLNADEVIEYRDKLAAEKNKTENGIIKANCPTDANSNQ